MKERIKELCKKNNISMNALEKELKLGIGYISKLGKSTPNAKNIQKIADRFGVSVDYIMKGTDAETRFSEENASVLTEILYDEDLTEALKKYFSMSEEQKKHVIATINMISKE